MPRDKEGGDSGPALVLFAYGLFIMISGAIAFNEAEMSDAALSAIFVGNGGAVVAFGCAAAVREHGNLVKGGPGWSEYMFGIHAGLALPVLYSAISIWRGVVAAAVPGKEFIVKYMAANVVAGVAVVGLLMRYRGSAAVPPAASDEAVEAMADAIKRATAAVEDSDGRKKKAGGKKKKTAGTAKAKTT